MPSSFWNISSWRRRNRRPFFIRRKMSNTSDQILFSGVQFCFLWWLYGSFRVCFVLNMVLEFWVWHWICYLKYPQNVCISQFFYMSGIDYTLCYGHHTLRTQRFEEHTINVPQFTDHQFTECPVFGPPLSGMHNLRTPTLRCNWLGNFIL